MSGEINGFYGLLLKEYSFRIAIICLNHKENSGIKHVYTKIERINKFHITINELIYFLRSSFKTVNLFEEL